MTQHNVQTHQKPRTRKPSLGYGELKVGIPDFEARKIVERVVGASVPAPSHAQLIRDREALLHNEQSVYSGRDHSTDLQALTDQAYRTVLKLAELGMPQSASLVLAGDTVAKGLAALAARGEGQHVKPTASDIDLMFFVEGKDAAWAEALLQSAGARATRTHVRVGRYHFIGGHIGDVHVHICLRRLENAHEFAGMIDVPEHRTVVLMNAVTFEPSWSYRGLGHGWLSGEVTTTTPRRVQRAERRGLFVPDALLALASTLPLDETIHLCPDGYLTGAQLEELEEERRQIAARPRTQLEITQEILEASAESAEDAAALFGDDADAPDPDELEDDNNLVE